jgi:hypothetical protein
MARHGVSVDDLQFAGTSTKARTAHDDLGRRPPRRLVVSRPRVAAACDLIQNAAVASILLDHTAQPAPRIPELFGYLTWVFGLSAGFVFVAGWIAAALQTGRMAPR